MIFFSSCCSSFKQYRQSASILNHSMMNTCHECTSERDISLKQHAGGIMQRIIYPTLLLATLGCQSALAEAIQVSQQLTVKPVVDVTYGIFNSQKSYLGAVDEGQKTWQEAVAKYGVDAEYQLGQGIAYSSVIGLSSGTFGDGDAASITTGDERKTSLEQWTLGWRNGPAEEATIDASVGRQSVVIADGFLVAGDALNFGKGYGDELNRGGGYYLAARQSFDLTAVLHYQINDALKTHWYYLESSNKAQAQPKLWSTDWEYKYANADFGLTYLQVTDVDGGDENPRNDIKDVAIRAKTQMNEQLALAAEYVYQDQQQGNENAWYASAQYTFDQVKYQPTLGYRLSSFSKDYDGLFYGNTDAGFGTWFQGEVAANYSGPYSTNTRIHQLSIQASVKENLHLGALAYQFDTIDKSYGDLDASEIDLFAVWSPNQNINVIPLVGFYKPKKDADHGGSQLGDTDTNTYAQLILQYVY